MIHDDEGRWVSKGIGYLWAGVYLSYTKDGAQLGEDEDPSKHGSVSEGEEVRVGKWIILCTKLEIISLCEANMNSSDHMDPYDNQDPFDHDADTCPGFPECPVIHRSLSPPTVPGSPLPPDDQ
jgi:hypothetical protein